MSNSILMQHKDIKESENTFSLRCESEKHKQNPGEKRKGERSDRPLNFPDYAKDKCQY